MDKLQDVFKFLELTHKFQRVKRVIFINGTEEKENDVEHSYQLAMLAWYIIDSQKLNLNKGLVIKYALIHDLVEVYAGDTYIYTQDESLKSNKKDRKYKAMEQLQKEFPEFSELHESLQDYELKNDAEAKFIYALDKIIPILNIYLDGGKTWKELEIKLQMLIEQKSDKVSISPEAKKYFDAILEILKQDEKKLFG